jgi:hypothetical protein
VKAIIISGLVAVAITLSIFAGESVHGVIVKKPYDATQAKGHKPGTTLITYHGGAAMTGSPVNVYMIYYGSGFPATTQPIINTFLSDLSNSAQYAVNSTYYDSANATIAARFSPANTYEDTGYSQGRQIKSNTVPAVIQYAIQQGLPADPNGVYFVITSPDVKVPGFCTSFCAYHTTSATISPGIHIRYALVPDPSQRCTVCDGNSAVYHQTVTPNGDAGADEMTDSIMHELSETVTDPDLSAWYTSSGSENGDLCNYTYGTTSPDPTYGAMANTILNGHYYLIQQIWTNISPQACVSAPPVP